MRVGNMCSWLAAEHRQRLLAGQKDLRLRSGEQGKPVSGRSKGVSLEVTEWLSASALFGQGDVVPGQPVRQRRAEQAQQHGVGNAQSLLARPRRASQGMCQVKAVHGQLHQPGLEELLERQQRLPAPVGRAGSVLAAASSAVRQAWSKAIASLTPLP